jgi:hypothetical protein
MLPVILLMVLKEPYTEFFTSEDVPCRSGEYEAYQLVSHFSL